MTLKPALLNQSGLHGALFALKISIDVSSTIISIDKYQTFPELEARSISSIGKRTRLETVTESLVDMSDREYRDGLCRQGVTSHPGEAETKWKGMDSMVDITWEP